jgi:DNA-binding MarR family transcriptional regulator
MLCAPPRKQEDEMADKLKTAAEPTTEARKPVEPGSEIEDLASLIVSVNRIGDRLQKIAKSENESLTITDWLLLHALEHEGPLAMTKAAYKVGVSRQRIHQQSTALKAIGLISVAVNEDGKTKTLSIAKPGVDLAKRMDEEIRKVLSSETGTLPTVVLHNAKRTAARILKQTSSLQPKKAEATAS